MKFKSAIDIVNMPSKRISRRLKDSSQQNAIKKRKKKDAETFQDVKFGDIELK